MKFGRITWSKFDRIEHPSEETQMKRIRKAEQTAIANRKKRKKRK